MPFDFEHPTENYGVTGNTNAAPQPGTDVEAALAEISRILHQMLFLAELSAGDHDVDRAVLQKELEQLQRKLDRIADTL